MFIERSRLSPFPVPVHMIASDLDVTFPLVLLEATARSIGAEVTVVKGAGHSTYFEAPQAFNAALDSFLAGIG